MIQLLRERLIDLYRSAAYLCGYRKPISKAISVACEAELGRMNVRSRCKTYWIEDMKGNARFVTILKLDINEEIDGSLYQALQKYLNWVVGTDCKLLHRAIQTTLIIHSKKEFLKRSANAMDVEAARDFIFDRIGG